MLVRVRSYITATWRRPLSFQQQWPVWHRVLMAAMLAIPACLCAVQATWTWNALVWAVAAFAVNQVIVVGGFTKGSGDFTFTTSLAAAAVALTPASEMAAMAFMFALLEATFGDYSRRAWTAAIGEASQMLLFAAAALALPATGPIALRILAAFAAVHAVMALYTLALLSFRGRTAIRQLLGDLAPMLLIEMRIGLPLATLLAVTTTRLSWAPLLAFPVIHAIETLAQRSEQLDRAQLQAHTDTLTGLLNRAGLRDALGDGPTTARGVLLMDIDHFKSVNDTWGHDHGDQVLQHVAAVLARTVGKSGLVARWGGEEFLCVIDDPEQAEFIAKRILREVDTYEAHQVTVSIGLDQMGARDDAWQALADSARTADGALYEAKRAGRNCLMLAS
jgi:diguanylate cyclase (GGDEF)-like protein